MVQHPFPLDLVMTQEQRMHDVNNVNDSNITQHGLALLSFVDLIEFDRVSMWFQQSVSHLSEGSGLTDLYSYVISLIPVISAVLSPL